MNLSSWGRTRPAAAGARGLARGTARAGRRRHVAAGGTAVVLLSVALAVTGCSRVRPIYNPAEVRLGLVPGAPVPMQEVAKAIWTAGNRLGWRISQVRPGELVGTLQRRRHVAVVTITHDAETFAITYKDSTNLMHSDGMIHRNYNRWIRNLEKEILLEVAKIPAR